MLRASPPAQGVEVEKVWYRHCPDHLLACQGQHGSRLPSAPQLRQRTVFEEQSGNESISIQHDPQRRWRWPFLVHFSASATSASVMPSFSSFSQTSCVRALLTDSRMIFSRVHARGSRGLRFGLPPPTGTHRHSLSIALAYPLLSDQWRNCALAGNVYRIAWWYTWRLPCEPISRSTMT